MESIIEYVVHQPVTNCTYACMQSVAAAVVAGVAADGTLCSHPWKQLIGDATVNPPPNHKHPTWGPHHHHDSSSIRGKSRLLRMTTPIQLRGQNNNAEKEKRKTKRTHPTHHHATQAPSVPPYYSTTLYRCLRMLLNSRLANEPCCTLSPPPPTITIPFIICVRQTSSQTTKHVTRLLYSKWYYLTV